MKNKREFYTAVAALDNEELAAFATAELAKMDAANEKRKNAEKKLSPKEAAKKEANEALKAQIVNDILTTEAMTAGQVAAALGEDIKVQKASALLRQLVAEGKAVGTDIKVPGKGTAKGYTLADAE